jgi:hypothetical protein
VPLAATAKSPRTPSNTITLRAHRLGWPVAHFTEGRQFVLDFIGPRPGRLEQAFAGRSTSHASGRARQQAQPEALFQSATAWRTADSETPR